MCLNGHTFSQILKALRRGVYDLPHFARRVPKGGQKCHKETVFDLRSCHSRASLDPHSPWAWMASGPVRSSVWTRRCALFGPCLIIGLGVKRGRGKLGGLWCLRAGSLWCSVEPTHGDEAAHEWGTGKSDISSDACGPTTRILFVNG